MTKSNPPRSQAKTGEMSTEVEIGDCRLEIVHAPQSVPGPYGHGGMRKSLMMLKGRKRGNAKMTETASSAPCSGSARNSERRPGASTWTTKGRVSCLAASSHRAWVLFASPRHLDSQRISAKALPHHVEAHHPPLPIPLIYPERSPLFAPPPTI